MFIPDNILDMQKQEAAPKLKFSIAKDEVEKLSALRLVACVYYREGFLWEDHVLPLWLDDIDSQMVKIIVVCAGEEVVGSVSLLYDDGVHELFEDAYPKAKQYRKEGKKYMDVGRFAVDTELLDSIGIPHAAVSIPLVSLALQDGFDSDRDIMVIEVSKSHAPVYENIGFKPDGEGRWCTFRGTSPPRFLLPFALDLNYCRANPDELSRSFMWRPAIQHTIKLEA